MTSRIDTIRDRLAKARGHDPAGIHGMFLLAHAPSDIAWLLAEVERLKTALDDIAYARLVDDGGTEVEEITEARRIARASLSDDAKEFMADMEKKGKNRAYPEET